MHLLLAQQGTLSEGNEAIDLGQTPGDVVFLSAADTELAGLASARCKLGAGAPDLRLANLMQLTHPMITAPITNTTTIIIPTHTPITRMDRL